MDFNSDSDDFSPSICTESAWKVHVEATVLPEVKRFKETYTRFFRKPNRIYLASQEMGWNPSNMWVEQEGFDATVEMIEANQLFTFHNSPCYLCAQGLLELATERVMDLLQQQPKQAVSLFLLQQQFHQLRQRLLECACSEEMGEPALMQFLAKSAFPIWNQAFEMWLQIGEHTPQSRPHSAIGEILHDFREAIFLTRQAASFWEREDESGDEDVEGAA